MRYCFILILFFFIDINICATKKQNDSLLVELKKATSISSRVEIYQDLVDINFYTPQEIKYLEEIYKLISKDAEHEEKAKIIADLIVSNLDQGRNDEAKRYINLLNQIPNSERIDRYKCYASMIAFYLGITEENKDIMLEEKLRLFGKDGGTNKSIYKKIEHAYIVATALQFQGKDKEATPYIELAAKEVAKLSVEAGINYIESVMRIQSQIYSRTKRNVEAIAITKKLITIKEYYYNTFCKRVRPFYPMEQFYIRNYTALLTNSLYLDKGEANNYLKIVLNLCKKVTDLPTKYNCFLATNNYHISTGNINAALEANDSLIRYAEQIAPYNLAGLHSTRSRLFENKGLYKKALQELQISGKIKDSLEVSDTRRELRLLQVEYDVNKLECEKAHLEVSNKQMVNIIMIVVLIFAVILCLYLYITLQKEKRLREKMRQLKNRAEASEKMKSCFIDSICHEIRTPLNAIVGFSNIIADEDYELDPESRLEFVKEISNNTWMLISLVESMVEVANLEVSNEILENKETDMAAICHNSMDKLSPYKKENIIYNTELSETPFLINTNEHYLSLVINSLLENANKFTDTGSITLKCERENENIIVSITDTGCGIPKEMHTAVFERFVKINEFKQGSGLGLYLCDLVVHRLLGEIYIDSSYTAGTRMIVKLPTEYPTK